nr:hypothetical protein [Halomonas salicampi]
MLPCSAPENCIELSAGKGALLSPIIKKWPNICISTCELDVANNAYLKKHFPGEHHNVDVVSRSFECIYKDDLASYDLAICNPPFSWRTNLDYEKKLLKDFGLSWMCGWSKIRTEVIFTIQNLKLIKSSGVLALILPDLIVFSDSFSKFRKYLCAGGSIVEISEIEAGSFKRTEARTFIVVMVKGVFENYFSLTRSDGEVSHHSQDEFSRWPSKFIKSDFFSLAESIFSLKRGVHSGKELRESDIPYYHTSGFSHNKNEESFIFSLEGKLVNSSRTIIGSTGDVLISRVGTRAIGKAEVVEKGRYVISDCVFRLSVPDYIDPFEIKDFWHASATEIFSSARGTCAKYLTKSDVLNHLARYLEIKHEDNIGSMNIALA